VQVNPFQNTSVTILDNKGHTLPDRHVGGSSSEKQLHAERYYHRPDATEKAFINGWYLTGELWLPGGRRTLYHRA